MKTVLKMIVAVFGVLLFARSASAIVGTVSSAKVLSVSAADNGTAALVGVTPPGAVGTGACLQFPTVDKYFRIPDNANGDKMRSLLMTAKLSGLTVNIAWDDTVRDASGYCYIRAMSIL